MAYRLLVVEDDNRMREIINDYFTAKGFEVFEAVDGAEALDRFSEAEYDITLTVHGYKYGVENTKFGVRFWFEIKTREK